MISMIDLLYFIDGVIMWVLAILCFREYTRFRFLNNLFLGFVFVSLGWLFPLILFFPFDPANLSSNFLFMYGANLLIPITLLFFNLFIDISLFNRFKFITPILSIISGYQLGWVIYHDSSYVYIETFYGDIMTMQIISDNELILLNSLLLTISVTIFRFLFYAYKFYKKSKQNFPYSKDITKFLLIMALGALLWIFGVILKREFPYYLYGIDFLGLAISYSVLIFYYIRNPHIFYFLPGGLTYLILIYQNGLHLFDLDLKSREIVDMNQKDLINESKNFPYNAFFSSQILLEQGSSIKSPSGSLENLHFKSVKIGIYSSAHIHWVLFSKSDSKRYNQLLKYNAEKFEQKFHKYLELMKHGKVATQDMKDFCKNQWALFY